MEMYSLLDREMGEYGAIMIERNDAAVRRGLTDFVSHAKESLQAKHPDHFDVMHVGSFNTDTGVVSPCEVPRLVANLGKLVREAANKVEVL